MKGRKSHPEFVSQYLQVCLQRGIVNSEDILQAAKDEISQIDTEIKRVEELKTQRSRLLEIIEIFGCPAEKPNNGSLLSLFSLSYPQTCKKICDTLKTHSSQTDYVVSKDPEELFCIKQMIEAKVINRIDSRIVQGERFNEYMKYILHQE